MGRVPPLGSLIASIRVPRPASFAVLWGFTALARGLLITVLPLTAHRVFGDAQVVSEFYFVVSLFGLAGSLTAPWLVGRLRRRWTFTLGVLCLIGASTLFAIGTVETFFVGMMLQLYGVIAMELPLNLYIMDHVPRRDLIRFEPLRSFITAGPWTLGPWLGVVLQTRVAAWTPFVASIAIAVVMLVCFWRLRIAARPTGGQSRPPPSNPIRFLPRFWRQPRLRLAWTLAFGRAAWWYMFFIYAPIYCVTSGLGEEMGGALVSLGSAAIFLAPIWGWLARRFGLRRFLATAYLLSGALTVVVATVAGEPWLGFGCFLLAATATSAIDGAGNTHFYRAVRPLERPEMTAAFSMYRDTAQLMPPGVFALLLRVLPLPFVFVAAGLGMAAMAAVARYIPKRM
ncbi:MAG: MFS transporter [Alphaproteobacteria bacterium]|nr:MFS transporter [Alphaproteobacteria bacterium]